MKKKEVKERPKIEAVEDTVKPREFVLKKKPKLAIVGCSDTNKKTPFHLKDEFEFWGVNNLYITMPGPWTRWFDIHHFEFDKNTNQWLRRGLNDFRCLNVKKYLEQLQALNIPIYMRAPCEIVPNAVLYPIDQMIALFGRYFTNTISYEIALGISEGYQEIHIYGVDMAVSTEYFWQRPSCEFFLGIAAGKGIKIVIPDECDLLKTRFLYGIEEKIDDKWRKKMKNMINSMQQQQAQAIKELDLARKKVDQYTGGISALLESDKIWGNM